MNVTPRDYQDAIDVQCARNLSAVVDSLQSVLERIELDARSHDLSMDAVNTHPIVVLYADKIANLSRMHGAEISNAYDACKEHAAPVRKAIVTSDLGKKPKIETVAAYLPSNYSVSWVENELVISGVDDHGWTLDGYVIPRLGSALIVAVEVKS